MTSRLLVLTACFVGTTSYIGFAMRPEHVPLREPLSMLPDQIGDWSGREAPALTAEILDVLGVDDYLNRIYRASPSRIIGLYIGYYQSQRQGDAIHSPMNCLPGAGWQPVQTTSVTIVVPGRTEPLRVNQVLVEKGLDRQIVLYWYQSHGRVIASDYWSKIYLVLDAIRMNRSDAALVRVTSPILNSQADASPTDAEREVTQFVQEMFPYLDHHLPS